jgi:hypothetical protein
MRIGGTYVGLGEGDVSPEIVKVKALLKRKFTPARNTLDDGDLFTPELTAEVRRVQGIYTAEGSRAHRGTSPASSTSNSNTMWGC